MSAQQLAQPEPTGRRGRQRNVTAPAANDSNVVREHVPMNPLAKVAVIACLAFLGIENFLLITQLWGNYFSNPSTDGALKALGIAAPILGVIFLQVADVHRHR